MITKVRIQNFQSIEDNTIEFGRLTVLVGAGDAGKSAVLRAIRAVLLNTGTDEDIREGEDAVLVELWLEDNQAIFWQKERGKGATYTLWSFVEEPPGKEPPGKLFTKLGGKVPAEIAELLSINEIEIDSSTSLTPQLSDQFDPPFIVAESGSKKARILGKMTRLDMVVTAQMMCKRMDRQLQGEIKHHSINLEELGEEREKIPDFVTLAERVQQAEKTLGIIGQAEETAARAQELVDELAKLPDYAPIDYDALLTTLSETSAALTRASSAVSVVLTAIEGCDHQIFEGEDLLNGTQHHLAEAQEAYVEARGAANICEDCPYA